MNSLVMEILIIWIITILFLIISFLLKRYYKELRMLSKVITIYSIMFGVYFTVLIIADNGYIPVVDSDILLFVLLCLMQLDAFLTEKALSVGAREINVGMRYLFNKFGIHNASMLIYPFYVFIAILLARYFPYSAIVAVISLYVVVVINNIIQYFNKRRLNVSRKIITQNN